MKLTDELRYQLLKHLEQNPEMSQRQLASELGPQNIRVNALCPGPLQTELLMKFLDTEEKIVDFFTFVPAICCCCSPTGENRDGRAQAIDGEDEEREQDLPTEIRHREHVAIDGENVHGLRWVREQMKG